MLGSSIFETRCHLRSAHWIWKVSNISSAICQSTVNRIVMVGLANDITMMLLFTFYFGHVTNKQDHLRVSIELQMLKPAHYAFV